MKRGSERAAARRRQGQWYVWRRDLWQWYSLLVLSNLRANRLLNHRAMGRVRTKHSRCKYGNPLLWWCAEYIERFINVEACSQYYSAYQVARFRAEPLFFRE